MRIKEGFVMHQIGGEYMAVATGKVAEEFTGFVRNNETADYIFSLLKEDTTEEAIIDAMCEKYDGDYMQIAEDVKNLISEMRAAGFLDE
ncbi:MAG: PqqD family protein [Faecalimonas sp.]|nr:PqqD family protein [Faecalimonas sp.]